MASTLSLAGFSSPTNVGAAGSFTVTALDAYGNKATGYTDTLHFTSSDALAGLPSNYTFNAGDNGSHTFSATLNTTGTQSLTATDTTAASIAGTLSGITVNPASLPAKTLGVTGFPTSVTAGVAGSITVTARDVNGHIAAGYRGTVHFTSSDPLATLPADYTFTGADQGVHIFTITLKKAGTQSFAATDAATASITGGQAGIVVKPGAAIQFAISAPATVTKGVAFTLTVTALDAFGNVATGYTGTVYFSGGNNGDQVPAEYTFTAGDAGVHTFVNQTSLKKKGADTILVYDLLNNPSLEGLDDINVV